MAEPSTVQALRELRARKKAQEEYDRMLNGLSGGLQERVERAGQNWWVKPSVLVDLIEHAESERDFTFVGGLAAEIDDKRVTSAYDRAVKMAEEAERKRRDRGFQWGDIADPFKGAARLGFSAAESGWQETQGLFRGIASGILDAPDVAKSISEGQVPSGQRGGKPSAIGPARSFQEKLNAIQGEGFVGTQSTFGVTISKLFDGLRGKEGGVSVGEVIFGDPDALGSGYFPGGEVRDEQRERAFRSANVNGQSLTPGRLVSHFVSEPGTDAYNWISGSIDAGLITVLDPANPALNAVGKAVKAAKYFEPTETRRLLGLVEGQRNTITGSVDQWLSGGSGRKFVDYLAKTDDAVEIWETSRRSIPVEWAVQLADESDPQVVDSLVRGFLGREVARKPSGWHYTSGGVAIRNFTRKAPLFGQMPKSGLLDTYDPQAFVTQIADELKNAHVPQDEIREIVGRSMRAATSGPPGIPLASDRYSVLTAAKEAVAAQLKAAGVDAPNSARLSRMWDSYGALRAYNIDVMTGLEVPLPNTMRAGGTVIQTPTPQTLEQMMSRFVPMPSMREYRAVSARTSKLARMSAANVKVGQKIASLQIGAGLAADTFSKVWKPLQIYRGAYVPRVVGDEQARMAAAGMSSMFSSPLSYFALAIMDDGRLGKVLNKAGVTVERYGTDVTGTRFATGAGGRLEAVDDTGYLADALYSSSAEMLFGAKTQRMPGFIAIAQREEGFHAAWADNLKFLHDNPIARRLASGEPIDAIKEWFWNSGYRGAIVGSADAKAVDEAGQVIAERLSPLAAQVSTRSHADEYIDHMLEWVEQITRGDAQLVDAVATGRLGDVPLHREMKATNDAVSYLQGLSDNGIAPDFVRGSPVLSTLPAAAEYAGAAISMLMDMVAARPSNWASRHPTFVQAYWKRVEDLIDLASPAARDDILRVAREEAKLPKDAIKRLERIQPAGELDADDLHALAGQHATDETKRLLYDLHNRGRFFDAFRLIFPFGEAWKEVLTTWGRLIPENPKSLRTLQKTIEGARGAGIVYTDEKTGEEMFTIPATAPLMKAFTGIRGDFRATTSGLSIAGSVIPGVGPAVQWGVGTFLPDKPEYKWVRDVVFQFGGEDEGIIKTLVPGWAEKLQKYLGAPESDRQFNSAMGEALNALASSGDYDLQNEADLERLQADAKEAARKVFFMRSVLQFFSPSAPQPRLMVETKEGPKITQALTEAFFNMAQQDYEGAVERFVERFGPLALMATVPYTRTEIDGKRVYGLRPSEEFGKFESSHSTLFRLYPRVAGLLGPQDEGYDFQVYERQAREYREPKSSTERLADLNSLLARMSFDRYKAKLPAKPNKAQRKWLADVRRELVAEFPGWNPNDFNTGDTSGAIDQLRRAIGHDSVKDLPLANALGEYFAFRDKAIAAADSSSWNIAKQARPIREWLRSVADEIGQETPEFNRVWDLLLSRELTDDLEEDDGR
jgi:hypothetical protein